MADHPSDPYHDYPGIESLITDLLSYQASYEYNVINVCQFHSNFATRMATYQHANAGLPAFNDPSILLAFQSYVHDRVTNHVPNRVANRDANRLSREQNLNQQQPPPVWNQNHYPSQWVQQPTPPWNAVQYPQWIQYPPMPNQFQPPNFQTPHFPSPQVQPPHSRPPQVQPPCPPSVIHAPAIGESHSSVSVLSSSNRQIRYDEMPLMTTKGNSFKDAIVTLQMNFKCHLNGSLQAYSAARLKKNSSDGVSIKYRVFTCDCNETPGGVHLRLLDKNYLSIPDERDFCVEIQRDVGVAKTLLHFPCVTSASSVAGIC
jgi:hypothetical protein